ncbi:hypothetical protein D3C74_341070 [compost metagenome]
MHGRLEHDRVEVAARVVEPDAVLLDLELAADLAERVEEGHHLRLRRALDGDVAAGREGRRAPGGRLDAVAQRGVLVAHELVDALDADHAVGVDRDDRAHLLQDGDEVHDLGLDRGARELGDALGADRGEQELLGGPDARVRQGDLGALEAARGADVDALLALVHHGAELAQDVQVVVDGAVADPAPAQVRDERLAQAVQQRPAEEDRDAARPGVRVDVRDVRRLDVGRVEVQRARDLVRDDLDAVQLEQPRHDADVADLRHVAQHAGPLAEQGGHHRLGDEVLRPSHGDGPVERCATVDVQQIVHVVVVA